MEENTRAELEALEAAAKGDDWRRLELKHTLHGKLLERINLDRLAEIDAPRVRKEVRAAVAALVSEEVPQMAGDDRETLIDQVLNEVFGLGPLDPLMQDDTISDILVTTSDLVHIERFGKLKKTGVRFKDGAHLTRIIQKIVGQAGRRIDESSPMVDCRLPDGSRVNAVIPPVAFEGPLLSIRKFSKDPLSAQDLVRRGALSEEMLQYLQLAVKNRRNILIAGGTGSGKTTMLNVLSAFIGTDERIVTIEDTAELQLRQEHVAKMETRPPNVEGGGAIRERQLVINALRMRPDRIILGEVRGEEALDMLQAMNTGHDGSLATIHANSCADAINRLEMMAGSASANISSASLRQQIASAVHVYVQVARLSDGTRKIVEIAESEGLSSRGVAELKRLFRFERDNPSDEGTVEGRFVSLRTDAAPKPHDPGRAPNAGPLPEVSTVEAAS